MDNIIAVFQKVLKYAKENGVSDLHLSVGSPWKFRHQGQITAVKQLQPLKMAECDEIVKHIVLNSHSVSEDDIDKTLGAMQDFDCSYSLPGIARFRVNICRQRGSFSIVLRVIAFEIPTVESLELPPVIRDIALEERGLILVTGITGSGKSTTLAAMINLINNTKPCKIVTIEDPLEFLHKEIKASVIQREVGSDTESFAKALRAALRQDPDIILVGEMRDRTTIDIAMKAAETGHLVLSTLHTVDAPRTIQRIISVFDLNEQLVIRKRLAESLTAVVSQRLLRKKDNSGRIAVLEIMRNTLTIKDCLENVEKTGFLSDYIAAGKDQYGMQTFDQHLQDLFERGVVDFETARAAATRPADFELKVRVH
ncbi:MAG: PilT/PilU family type 4a pilus ATPase [Nitrospirae bacterium]|nr:MAG: PilT/PilU family type 4a pilus ATPase [Nitrospirota bacterium]